MIYFVKRKDGDIKIGYTADGYFQKRFTALEGDYGDLVPIGYIDGDQETERAIHREFAQYRRLFPGRKNKGGNPVYSEFFEPAPELITFIMLLAKPFPPMKFNRNGRYRTHVVPQPYDDDEIREYFS